MRNLKTIEGKVRAVLQKDEEARNDDMLLYLKVCNGCLKDTGAMPFAEVKRMVGLDMHKAPNAVEQRKHEYHPCPPEKVEAIKDALRHFGLVSE